MNYKELIAQLGKTDFSQISCTYCGNAAASPNGEDTICNFCESYVNSSESEFIGDAGNVPLLLEAQEFVGKGLWKEAISRIEQLLAGTEDPFLFYASAAFYKYYADTCYYGMDYSLKGFMHENATNMRKSLDLTAKWKECLYKSVWFVEKEMKIHSPVDEGLLYIRFMSQAKLNNYIEAKKALSDLVNLGKEDFMADYAQMVYAVEFETKNAMPMIEKLLKRNDLNTFYYLAKHLAKNRNASEAKLIIEKIAEKGSVPIAFPLLKIIEADEEHYK